LKRYLPKNAEDASALIITLLVVVLLSTIAVSFLSTARIEQTATRNYSSKTMAEQFAISATEQAMAKIQEGFTVNGTATTIITTQPGAIWQFTFSGGSCNAVATKNPVELFSGTGNVTTNGTANLNNLQSPSSNSTATSNRWTITGNASEQINVPFENITSNGTILGRIAYYVDDEGTKLNVNAATGNRSTLNVGTRPQDIAALVSATQAASFSTVVNNSTTNNSSVTGWSYFFRPEQVSAAVTGFSGNNTPFLSTATTSASSTANLTHLLTPWGTQRIPINTLSTNATNGAGNASVSSIFEALTGLNGTSVNGTYTASNSTYGNTGRGLQNIFGGNFSTKYTPAGVKQIAANMLQMRDPNTFSVNASFGYNGSTLCDALGPDPDPYNTTQNYFGIPSNYLANTPFPVINEIGATAVYGLGNALQFRVRLYHWIELFNPYDVPYTNTTNATLVFMLDKIQFRTNNTGNTTVGVAQDFRAYQGINEDAFFNWYGGPNNDVYDSGNRSEPFVRIPNIPARSTQTIFLEAVINWWSVPRGGSNTYPGINSNSTSITGNITTRIERILLLANKDNPLSIRDAISGNDTGDFIFPSITMSITSGKRDIAPIPGNGSITFKRLDARNKTTRNGTATGAFVLDGNTSITRNGSSYQDNIAPAPDSTSGNTIPGDPILSNNSTYLLTSNSSADKLPPVLDFPAFSSPADLGKVPTNTLYRSLRMQMQPAIEGTRIPDWAMLDVISFGNSTNSTNPLTRLSPVNLNGRFYLPGNASITPRAIGLRALAKVLEISANGTIQNPIDVAQSANLTATNNVTRFKGATANATTIANAIGNMRWSGSSSWDTRRNALRFPSDQYILPSEIMEIEGVADAVSQTDYINSSSHFKWNEGRASALIPAVTTRSSFFAIYAYAQALDKSLNVESEALTKTLVEVLSDTSTTPTTYKVKKLYTQPILIGG
jgi:Tfp pilus assembly protein PilX